VDAVQGLLQLRSGYWTEAAFVAERVLTTSELKGYVDALPAHGLKDDDTLSSAREFRHVLARRLVREGKFAEADPYFTKEEEKELLRQLRKGLAEASNSKLSRVQRARAWHEVAQLTRFKGMELMGYEGPPDFAVYEGSYAREFSVTEATPWVSRDERTRLSVCEAARRAPHCLLGIERDCCCHIRGVAPDSQRVANLHSP
jgi:hypothetical protein